MYAPMPSRRWCREVLALRHAATDLLDAGTLLTDPRILSLSRRLDRLMLDAFGPRPTAQPTQGSAPSATPAHSLPVLAPGTGTDLAITHAPSAPSTAVAKASASKGRRSARPSPTPT